MSSILDLGGPYRGTYYTPQSPNLKISSFYNRNIRNGYGRLNCHILTIESGRKVTKVSDVSSVTSDYFCTSRYTLGPFEEISSVTESP